MTRDENTVTAGGAGGEVMEGSRMVEGGGGAEIKAPHLSEDALDAGQRETRVVGLDDPPQQLVAQHLQDHAHVWSAIKEWVFRPWWTTFLGPV